MNVYDMKVKFEPEHIPAYCPLLRSLLLSWKIEDKVEFVKIFEERMNEAYKILRKGSFYEIYDIVACIVTIMTT